ncbi:phage tail sheath subtilisin-like domain-containing protein [Mesorhizobium sp. M0767]|uniref:phage tail sheath subtilisin-like domain-containing protein n=1 Tax=Mesorhizobium sp. M0767 TaxID=2956995 RepID=UPI0033365F08
MGILFNNIPGAGLVAPLFAFEVTSGGSYQSASRLLLIGHKNTGALIADNTPTPVGSAQEAVALCGAGSMLAEMARVAFLNAPTQETWILAAPATGTARVDTIKVNSVPAGGGVATIEIAGEPVQVQIAAGDSVNTVAAALAAAINAYFNALTGAALSVAATVATDTVTVTARHLGLIYVDYDFYVPTVVAGNAFAGAAVTITNTVVPTGSPDLSAALAALGDDPFDWIVSPFSDATNIARYTAAMNDVSGRWAYNRQVYGHVFTTAAGTLSALTTIGLALNDRHLTIHPRLPVAAGNPTPAWLAAAARTARIVPWLSDDATGNVSRNQKGLVVQGERPPRDRSLVPTYAGRNTMLRSGISSVIVNTDGGVAIDKIVTTYQKDANSQPDETFRDIQAMGQLVAILRYFRAQLSYEHGQKALADENPGGLGALSPPKSIQAPLVHAADTLENRGVLENARGFADRLIVQRNSQSANRVDIMAPIDRVNPLDVIAANAMLYSQYRAA